MFKGRGSLFFWVAGVLLCLGLSGWGQDRNARLVGTVQAVSGTPLAKATLTVRGTLGPEVVIETDAQGRYEATGLATRKYEVRVTAAGYGGQVRQNLEVGAGQTVVADFRLDATGAGSPPAQDAAEQPPRPAATSGVIDQSQLVGLPMNGRSYTQLATLQAGVSDPAGGGRQGGQGASLTISGGRGEWNSFLQDGTDINDTDNQVPRSAAGGQLGADAVLQVQVFATNYGAQYGRAAGGVMNAVTRSGSNELHGTLFEFFRNSKMDSRNFFDPSAKPPFKRNQFGATAAGPLVRDRTYFMASFETLLNRLTQTYVSFVPDSEARSGKLRLPGGSILANEKILPYLKLYPLPQVPVLDRNGNPTGVAENRTAARLPTSEYFFVTRIDQRLRDQDALFVRYTFDDAINMDVGSVPDMPWHIESRQQYLTLAETHFFSPALLNTFRTSYTRPVLRFSVKPVREIPRSLFFVPSAPQYGSINVSGLTVFGAMPDAPYAKAMNSFQFADDLLYRRGSHTWRLGALVERFRWNVFDSQTMGAQWAFTSLESFFRLGPGTRLTVALPDSSSERAFRQTLLGFYFQDDYQLRRNLALNLGLRYEFTTMIHDIRGRDVYLLDELRDTEPLTGRLMGSNPTLRNLSPRVGLSWSPGNNQRTQVRAGVGIYHEPLLEYTVDNLRNTLPFFKLTVRPNFEPLDTFPDAVAAAGAVADQVRIFEYQNPKTPTVYRYNLSIQRELAPNWTTEISYVGARGNHLLRTIEANLYPFPVRQTDGRLFFPPDPDWINPDGSVYSSRDPSRPQTPSDNSMNPEFGSIQKTLTDAQSFYNSGYVSINGRFGSSLTLGANYTFSKSVDDASSVGAAQDHYGLDRKLNRGLSSFDTRHRFSLRYFYNPPFGPGQRWLNSGWLSWMLGGWRLGGILSMRYGSSLGVTYGIPSTGFLFVSQRPNLNPSYHGNPTSGVTAGCQHPVTGETLVEAGRELGGPDLYFDPCAFTPPEAGYIGNAGRSILTGPGVVNLDFSLQKELAIDSQRRLQFRAEFFNLPNHTNFRPPSGPTATIFREGGTVNPSVGKMRLTATTPRQIQFALRLSF